jgi:hypothetical protein
MITTVAMHLLFAFEDIAEVGFDFHAKQCYVPLAHAFTLLNLQCTRSSWIQHAGHEQVVACGCRLSHEGDRLFARPRPRWKDKIKETQCEFFVLATFASTLGPFAGCFEHSTEPSGSVKGGEFVDQLSDCQLLTQ